MASIIIERHLLFLIAQHIAHVDLLSNRTLDNSI